MKIYDERLSVIDGQDIVLSGEVLAVKERRSLIGNETFGLGLSLDTGYYVQLDWHEACQIADQVAIRKAMGGAREA